MSPVSVSLFVNDPDEGFEHFGRNPSGASTFLYKLMNMCSKDIASELLDIIFGDSVKKEISYGKLKVSTHNSILTVLTQGSGKDFVSSVVVQKFVPPLVVISMLFRASKGGAQTFANLY